MAVGATEAKATRDFRERPDGGFPRRPQVGPRLPGPKAAAIVARDAAVMSPSLTRPYPLVIDHGSGCWVTDVDGNEFLDLTAGIAVSATGYANPIVAEAINKQARRFLHMAGTDFYYEPQVHLAERLAELAPLGGPGRVFFTNSGAEAVEGAMKLARWSTGRPHFLAFTGAFHGRTFGALSLTASKAIQRDRFAPLLPGVFHVPYPSRSPGGPATAETIARIADIFRTVAKPESFAAVFVEPIQGEGGYVVPPDDFLPQLRELTSRHGILLVVDEIQTGMGRTGQLFACEHSELAVDIVTLAKGIASGLPLGAIIARADHMSWPPGTHGSTFGGNPVSCAAALATLDLLDEGGLMANTRARGAQLRSGLECLRGAHPDLLTDVRGRGLMLAVDCISSAVANQLMLECFQRGLLMLSAGERALRLSPPLILSAEEATVALEILEEACQDLDVRRTR